MIILSNAIPKSGSTLLANFQEDILESLEVKNGQRFLRAQYGGRYIESLSKAVAWNLVKMNVRHGSLVVKCHWAPSPRLELYCRVFNVKMTMAYRDPRDVMLSMIDHGRRTRAGKDPGGPFAGCKDIRDLIPRTVKSFDDLNVWRSKGFVHCVRYETLVTDPSKTLREMVSFLGWTVEDRTIERIVTKREQGKHTSWNFNKGTTERWKTELTESEKKACRTAFGDHLVGLGYELD